jgi:hypothetical protein
MNKQRGWSDLAVQIIAGIIVSAIVSVGGFLIAAGEKGAQLDRIEATVIQLVHNHEETRERLSRLEGQFTQNQEDRNHARDSKR